MNAGKNLIQQIFANGRLLEIPFYQRSYVWKEEQWERFLEDFKYVSKSQKPYFMGSVILKTSALEPKKWGPVSNCKIVIDGQQRLTTLLIFMKVLCLKMNDDETFKWNFTLKNGNITLIHGRNDIDDFQKIVSQTVAEPINNNKNRSQIIKAYNYFLENIDKDDFEIDVILQNIQFVSIDLDAEEDEQQIFDTINSLGVNLTTAELLKNYFFNRDNVQEYVDKWENIFEKDAAAKDYWDITIETGRIHRSMIDIFFDAYFQIFVQDAAYKVSTSDKLMYGRLDKLSKSYPHFINTYCNGNKDVILSPMKEYANRFREIFDPNALGSSVPKDYGVERINTLIFGLKNTTLIQYVLYLEMNAPKDELNKIYTLLESYIMRRIVVQATNKGYSRLFPSLILNKVNTYDELKERLIAGDTDNYFPTDSDLENGFHNSKLINLQSKGILYMLESAIRVSSQSTALLGFNGYSLEHLMPKKWRNYWPKCASDDLAKERDTILLTLGNLAIITQTLNASIRDSNWIDKKAGKPNKPGLKSCASGLVTLEDALNKADWNEDEIKKRADWLYNKAKDIWRV